MASLLRIAGRTLANKARAFLVDDDGRLEVKAQLQGSDESIPVQIESRNTPLWSGSRKYPVPLKVSRDEVQQRHSHMAMWDKDGRLFGRNFTGSQIWYSDDGWRTQKIFRFLDEGFLCQGIVAVSRDKVLVALNHDADPNLTGLYVIDNIEAPKEEQRFERVLGWERNHPHEMFGYDVYPYHGESRIILATEYAVTSDPNWGRHVHLSTDGGETWRTIFELPELVPGSTHIHSAHYDAYADRIWIVSGDGMANNVFYSDDWASPDPTWNTVWPHGEASIQFTSVWSTPTHVFFATDRASQQGIWSYERNPVNVRDTPTIRPHFIVAEGGLTLAGCHFRPTPDGLGAYVVLRGAERDFPAHILGTRDGVTWYELYRNLRQTISGFWQQPVNAFEVDGELIYWQDDEIIRSRIAWETR